MFIVLEGSDGCGKSSQIEPLAQHLRSRGREVVLTREPGGTDLAEKLRALMLFEPMDQLTEALLAFAARRDHLQRTIAPALQRGACVICDRFTPSTVAYQGFGRGFDLGRIEQLRTWTLSGLGGSDGRDGRPAQDMLEPNLVLWYDVPPQVAAQRRAQRGQPANAAGAGADRFEQQDLEFFQRVQAGYEACFAPQLGRAVRRIDASASLQAVSEATLREVDDRMAELERPAPSDHQNQHLRQQVRG